MTVWQVISNSYNEAKIENLISQDVDFARVNARDLIAVLNELRKRNLQSVLVEGGTEIAGAFVDAKLVDKISFFYAPLLIGGNAAPLAIGGKGADTLKNAMQLRDLEITKHENDLELTGYPIF